MLQGTGGRTILAVIAGYAANALLVGITEGLVSSPGPGRGAALARYYFVVDLISQCAYTVVAGYVCCAIARPLQRTAMAGLITAGVLVGMVSLIASWKSEPHWYGISLLLVYAPGVWMGWTLRVRRKL